MNDQRPKDPPHPVAVPQPYVDPARTPTGEMRIVAAVEKRAGRPLFPPVLMKLIVPVVAIAGAIAIAPSMGVDLSWLHPNVPKAAALIAFIGMTLGIAGPGVKRK